MKQLFAKVEHRKSSDNKKYRIVHSFKVGFLKKLRHGAFGHSITLDQEKRVIRPFVATAVVGIMLVVVVYKARLAAMWVGRIWPLARPISVPSAEIDLGCKLVITGTALILLITLRIPTITVKVFKVVAFLAINLI